MERGRQEGRAVEEEREVEERDLNNWGLEGRWGGENACMNAHKHAHRQAYKQSK